MKDPLSLLLERSGVAGSVFCRAELTAPWSISTTGSGDPGAGRPAIFHVIVRGAGFARVEPDRADEGASPKEVSWRSGDVIMMPHGDPHIMSSHPSERPVPIASLPSRPSEDGLPCITHGGDGPETSILCGTVRFSEEAEELLRPHLPPLLHLQCAQGPAAAWLDATLRLLGAEVSGALPGADTVIARLAEVLFVQALRAWIRDLPRGEGGWLAALSDPNLSRVLGAIHEAPAEPWTVAMLARHAGLSRSVFYSRFTDVMGEPPATYLTRWRMHIARRALRRGDSVAEIAEQTGYGSEAAFSRAFKRTVGDTPSAWRSARQDSA